MLPNRYTTNDPERPDTLYIRYPLLHSHGAGPYPLPSSPAGSSSDWFWHLLTLTEVPLSRVVSISNAVGKTWAGPKVTRRLSVEPALWFCPMCQHSWHTEQEHVLCPACGLSVQCKHRIMATAGYELRCVCGHARGAHKRHWSGPQCADGCACQGFTSSGAGVLTWHDAIDLCAICNGEPLRVAKESVNSEKHPKIEQVVGVGKAVSLPLPDADPRYCPECGESRPERKGVYKGEWQCQQCHTDLKGPWAYDPAVHKLWPESQGIVFDTLQRVTKRWVNQVGKDAQNKRASIEALWSLTSPYGVLTVCGVCLTGLAHDHQGEMISAKLTDPETTRGLKTRGFHTNEQAPRRTLNAKQRTRKCKWCSEALENDYERMLKDKRYPREGFRCPAAPSGETYHQRKWLRASAKVPACPDCMARYHDGIELQCQFDELRKAPGDDRIPRCHLALQYWHEKVATLQAEGVTLADIMEASEVEQALEQEEQDYVNISLEKIISGGQTGGDEGGLKAGKALGLQTGGFAPKGWRVDGGTNPWLAEYGLVETTSSNYTLRTEENVKASDATVIFGDAHSPGCGLTQRLCKRHGKPVFLVAKDAMDSATAFQTWLVEHYDFLMAALGGSDAAS